MSYDEAVVVQVKVTRLDAFPLRQAPTSLLQGAEYSTALHTKPNALNRVVYHSFDGSKGFSPSLRRLARNTLYEAEQMSRSTSSTPIPRLASSYRQRRLKTSKPFTPSPLPTPQTLGDDLREVSRLLQLIYHRNKNQHRTQKWWKWLGILRRSISKLLEFEEKGWRRREQEEKKQQLEKWVRVVVVPKAWL
jgi:hypothetical protein